MSSIEIELSPKTKNPDGTILQRKCAHLPCQETFPASGYSDQKYCSTLCRRAANPKVVRLKSSGTPEYYTVATHRQSIRTAYKSKNATYQDMPFCEAWDPDRGGSYIAGAKWIVENLGKRPSRDYELHIVDRRLGFVPGNLAWVPRADHKREEMLTKLLIENLQLKNRIRDLENSLDKV